VLGLLCHLRLGMHRQKGQRHLPLLEDDLGCPGAIHAPAQLDIHQHQVKLRQLLYRLHRLLAAVRQDHLVAMFFEHPGQGHRQDDFIVHQQDGPGSKIGGYLICHISYFHRIN